jgi:surface protein
MNWMFMRCEKLTNLDVSYFNTSKVTNMSAMFRNCNSLASLDLSSFNTSKVTNMSYMLYGCTNLRTIYVDDGWSTAAVTSSTDMFLNCSSLVGGQGTTYDANHVDKTYAHIDGGPSNPGYFTAEGQQPWTAPEPYACYTPENTTLTFYYDGLRSTRPGTTYDMNTGINFPDWQIDHTNGSVTHVVFDPSFANARPRTTSAWFYEMSKLKSITDLHYLNTDSVTYMGAMFSRCFALENVDLSNFNTDNVTSMTQMFFYCASLSSLDLGSFNTAKVANMNRMFYACQNLQTIYVGNGWSTDAVTTSIEMLNACTSLVGGMGTTYDESNPKDKTYAHIDGGPSNPGYFTDKNAGQRGDVDGDGDVSISDVSLLIDYLLSGSATDFNLAGADADQDGEVGIADASAIIDYLLSGSW